jgi:3-deoxy-D-manno-octulosonic acid kinase
VARWGVNERSGTAARHDAVRVARSAGCAQPIVPGPARRTRAGGDRRYFATMTTFQRDIPDTVPPDFELLRFPGLRIVVRRGYEPALEPLGFLGGEVAAVGSSVGGREAHPIVELSSGERILVRRFRRGGLLRHLNRGRYFFGHRAFDEARVTEWAGRYGVRVPVVIGALERGARPGYTASLATRWIPGASELIEWLRDRDPAEHCTVLRAAGREIGRMHEAGVSHPDLNLRNLLVAETAGPSDQIYIVDFDRAKLRSGPVPPARRRRDLLRLRRSADKLAAPIRDAGWTAFREGYGEGWPASARLG